MVSIWDADLTDMQLLSTCHKEISFYCVILKRSIYRLNNLKIPISISFPTISATANSELLNVFIK